MTIDWQTTLTAVDQRLAVTPSTFGSGLRSALASAGTAYDQYFPPGSPSTLGESSDYIRWRANIATQVASLDEAARMAESEAVIANGGNPLLTGQVLAPHVPLLRVSSKTPNGPETRASCSIGEAVFEAIEPGTLGNSIRIRVFHESTTVGAPASKVTSTYALDGVDHTLITDVPSTLRTVSNSKIEISLGAYVEQFLFLQPESLGPPPPMTSPIGGKSLLVSGSWGTSNAAPASDGFLNGAIGETLTLARRLKRATTLPGLSPATLRIVTAAASTTLVAAPSPATARFNQPIASRSSGGHTRESLAESVARKALRDKGQLPSEPRAPTYGQIETALVDALAVAASWLLTA